jgi:hypothetical protein
MPGPENEAVRESQEAKTDSLNCDDLEITEATGVVDRTIHPMPDWKRIARGLPPRKQQPPESSNAPPST